LRFVSAEMSSRGGSSRDVALNVPHWLIVSRVLARTDLISVMPERLADAIKGKEVVARNFAVRL
jgi:hypothetical protein